MEAGIIKRHFSYIIFRLCHCFFHFEEFKSRTTLQPADTKQKSFDQIYPGEPKQRAQKTNVAMGNGEVARMRSKMERHFSTGKLFQHILPVQQVRCVEIVCWERLFGWQT